VLNFAIFDHLDSDGGPLGRFLEYRLRLLELIEQAGFQAYHLAEHHSTPLGMASSPSVFLAAAIQRTSKIKLGPLVYVLPLYHPLRVYEEVCMLDHLSKGRFMLGVGRGGALLLGTDLVKPEPELLLAYDDPLGVTAAFNLNLLVRVNRELDGDFDVNGFSHRAVWNAQESRVEMHLVSRSRQRVRVRASGIDITFDAGESIWTESSYKYRIDDLAPMLERAGFRVTAQWRQDGFALTLAEGR